MGHAMGADLGPCFSRNWAMGAEDDEQRIYIMAKTRGAHLAPIASPCRTLTAWGMILIPDK